MINYENEVFERWGDTNAYKEHTAKTKNYTDEKWTDVNNGLMNIFADFAECKNKGNAPDSSDTLAMVSTLQKYITLNFYTCTDDILLGLGKLYVADERFKNNIDKYGEGNAAYVSKAITCYLGVKQNV